MCEKTQFKYCPSTIDKCMRKELEELKNIGSSHEVVACCCGHGRYPKTIVLRGYANGNVWEKFSGKAIPRKKKFYKRDKKGYYYIPEVCDGKN